MFHFDTLIKSNKGRTKKKHHQHFSFSLIHYLLLFNILQFELKTKTKREREAEIQPQKVLKQEREKKLKKKYCIWNEKQWTKKFMSFSFQCHHKSLLKSTKPFWKNEWNEKNKKYRRTTGVGRSFCSNMYNIQTYFKKKKGNKMKWTFGCLHNKILW